jgi:hypothetical protein
MLPLGLDGREELAGVFRTDPMPFALLLEVRGVRREPGRRWEANSPTVGLLAAGGARRAAGTWRCPYGAKSHSETLLRRGPTRVMEGCG